MLVFQCQKQRTHHGAIGKNYIQPFAATIQFDRDMKHMLYTHKPSGKMQTPSQLLDGMDVTTGFLPGAFQFQLEPQDVVGKLMIEKCI